VGRGGLVGGIAVAGPGSSAHSKKLSQATQKAASSSLLTPQLEQSFTTVIPITFISDAHGQARAPSLRITKPDGDAVSLWAAGSGAGRHR
jgi:hypothetical protein